MSARSAIVTGSGVAGWTAAWRLLQAGWRVELRSNEAQPGGLLRPVQVAGWPCNRGAHRLHTGALSVPAVAELAAEVPLEPRRRQGRVLWGGRAWRYPLHFADLARGLGVQGGGELLASLAKARLEGGWERGRTVDPDVGFATFVRRQAGEAAYERFYRPYAEKVWGVDPDTLSQTCAAKQRLSSSSPWRLLWGRDRHRFLVPRGGLGAWVAALARKAEQAGVRVAEPAPVDAAWLASCEADAVVHTGHLADALTPDQRAVAALDHRGLQLLWLWAPDERPGEVDTWYAPEPCYNFGRVSELARFLGADAGRGRLLCVELPLGGHSHRSLDLDQLRAQLDDAGILSARAGVAELAEHTEPAVYPLYLRGWRARWRQAVQAACGGGKLWLAGRQGLWLHCNLDHAMASAEAAVAHVLQHAGATGSATWPMEAARWTDVRVRD